MNLNRNSRWEQFDVDDDARICDFFEGFADTIAGVAGSGLLGKANLQDDEEFGKVVTLASQGSKHASAAEVLRWIELSGKGRIEASRHFGIPEGTVASWMARGVPRAALAASPSPDATAGQGGRVQTRAEYLRQCLDEFADAKREATAGQLPILQRQEMLVHEELVQVEEAERIAAGEFRDPREMISRIIAALEGGVQLLERDDVDRLHRVVEQGLRLTATQQPAPSDGRRP